MNLALLRAFARSALPAIKAALALFGAAFALMGTTGQVQAGLEEFQLCAQSCAASQLNSREQDACIHINCSELLGTKTPSVNRLPPIPTLYGAIAVDPQTLASGSAKGMTSRAAAERRALADCQRASGRASSCKIAVYGHNICLALATSRETDGRGNAWGADYSDDGWVARRKATKICHKWGGRRCQVSLSFCTG
jgi:hypothetical protein